MSALTEPFNLAHCHDLSLLVLSPHDLDEVPFFECHVLLRYFGVLGVVGLTVHTRCIDTLFIFVVECASPHNLVVIPSVRPQQP